MELIDKQERTQDGETYQEMVLRSRGEQLERTQKALREAQEEIAKWEKEARLQYKLFNEEIEESRRWRERAIQAEQELKEFKTLLNIIDRAKRIALANQEEETDRPSFKMDANGNLTRIDS